MIIRIEIESIVELERLLGWRDDLRDRIAQLEAQPLRFSLLSVANKVCEDMPGLTPDQKRALHALIQEPDV